MLYVIVGDQSRDLHFDELLHDIKNKNPFIEEKVFDAISGENDGFINAIQSNSIFGGKELLVLKRGENIKKLDDFFKALQLFDLSNKELIISITTDEKGLNKKNVDIIKKLGEYIFITKPKGNNKELIEYIKTELDVDNKIALEILLMIGNNVLKIKNELEKLKNFFNDKPFNFNEAKKLITVNIEYSLFEQVDKLLKGDKKSVLEYLKTEGNGQLFLFWLGQELKELLKLSLLTSEGKLVNTSNYNQFKVKFDENSEFFVGKHPYRVFKTMENLRGFTSPRLKELLKELLDTEYKIKSGYGEEKILIDLLVLKL